MDKPKETSAVCINRIRQILADARATALQSVNAAMVSAYWEIGREIVQEEQRGAERAKYGALLIQEVSTRLTREFGRGFSKRTVWKMRQFYLLFADRLPPTTYTSGSGVDGASANSEFEKIVPTVSAQSESVDSSPLSFGLSWSHYCEIMGVSNAAARQFYELECAKANWSVRQLKRQIGSMLYERLALSKDKQGVMALAQKGQEVQTADDLIKDPYVLEFTGLPERADLQERDLEQALIDKLQQFLLELGQDLHFVARQQRITIDGDHFYIDLVFYHRVLRCFLLIDLKLDRLTQQDLGQMLLYTGYYDLEVKRPDENPPIGLVLCADKNQAVVRYTLSQSANQVFASRYQLHLPSEKQLAKALQKERQLLEAKRNRG